jgi:hypothetical protein
MLTEPYGTKHDRPETGQACKEICKARSNRAEMQMTLSDVFIPAIVAAYFVGAIPFGPIIKRRHDIMGRSC